MINVKIQWLKKFNIEHWSKLNLEKSFVIPMWIESLKRSCDSVVLTGKQQVHHAKSRLLVDSQIP